MSIAEDEGWHLVQRFSLAEDLRPLVHYMQAAGIFHRVAEADNQQCLWLQDAEDVIRVQGFIEQGGLERTVVSATSERPHWGYATLLLLDRYTVTLLTIYFGVLGALLIGVDVHWRWVSWVTFLDFNGVPTAQHWVPWKETMAQGQWWRLWSPVFLHFGVFHIAFNGLWIWEFGRRIERYYGSLMTLLLLGLLAAASNIAQFLWSGPTLFGGLSGVVYGLMGFLWMIQRINPRPELAVPSGIIGFMLFWQALCLFGVIDYFIDGGIANGAHMGGLATGMLLGIYAARR